MSCCSNCCYGYNKIWWKICRSLDRTLCSVLRGFRRVPGTSRLLLHHQSQHRPQLRIGGEPPRGKEDSAATPPGIFGSGPLPSFRRPRVGPGGLRFRVRPGGASGRRKKGGRRTDVGRFSGRRRKSSSPQENNKSLGTPLVRRLCLLGGEREPGTEIFLAGRRKSREIVTEIRRSSGRWRRSLSKGPFKS